MIYNNENSVSDTNTNNSKPEVKITCAKSTGYFKLSDGMEGREWARQSMFVTPRNVGKTTDTLKQMLKMCTQETYTSYDAVTGEEFTKNKEFIGLRRSEREVIEFKKSIQGKLERIGLKITGNVFTDRNGVIVGRVYHLSGANNLKSNFFEHCCAVVYDEFIAGDTKPYLKNEMTLGVDFLITVERFKEDKYASDGIGFQVIMLSNRNSDNNPYRVALDLWFDDSDIIERKDQKFVAFSLKEKHFKIPQAQTSIARMGAKTSDELYGVAYGGENTFDETRSIVQNPKRMINPQCIKSYIILGVKVYLYRHSKGYMMTTPGRKENMKPLTIYRRDTLINGNGLTLKTLITEVKNGEYLLTTSSLKFNNYELTETIIRMVEQVLGKTENGEKK